jgi:two-component system NtrC family response regulator
MNSNRILIVDDDVSLVRVMKHHLTGAGYDVQTAIDGREGVELHRTGRVSAIFTDLQMPEMDGLAFINAVRSFDSMVSIVVITGYPSIDKAVAAMKAGAVDFIEKPVEKEHLLIVAEKACAFSALQDENSRLRNLVAGHLDFGMMVGSSAAIRNVYDLARNVSDSNVTVLIYGETGTGKEMLAKTLHNNSRRNNKRFVAVNCAAVPSNLLESELFGHVKGAFTGAVNDRLGLIGEANGGTLFLDEIGDLPLDLQPKLLRVLQEREFHPVGSNKSTRTDARFIFATHRDLRAMVDDRSFREDLYYRLNVVPITIPPIRQRTEDILPLFMHFLKKAANDENKNMPDPDKSVIRCLEQYPWPGNVREIQNIAQRIMAIYSGSVITTNELPEVFTKTDLKNNIEYELPDSGIDLEAMVDRIVLKALEKNQWNQSKTAEFLSISRNTLIYRMNKNGLIRDGVEK